MILDRKTNEQKCVQEVEAILIFDIVMVKKATKHHFASVLADEL